MLQFSFVRPIFFSHQLHGLLLVMENGSLFAGIPSQSVPQKSRREDIVRQENSKRFARLKPICVELLGQVSGKNDERLHNILKRLYDLLITFKTSDVSVEGYSPFSPALTSYIFYPIAQLFRTIPNPPDRIRILQFSILAFLADDWWQAWIEEKPEAVKQSWQIWEQLLILAVTALDTKTKSGTKNLPSEECTSSILDLLHSLLTPRVARRCKENKDDFLHRAAAWEWDGESDLPDIDDYEAEMERLADEASGKKADTDLPELQLVYPTDVHLSSTFSSQTCQGVLAHALSTSLERASVKMASRKNRLSCLQLVRVILQVWIAGSNTTTELSREVNLFNADTAACARSAKHFSHEAQADRLVIALPATVSSVVRICNESKCPSEVLAESICVLKSVLVATLNDAISPELTRNVSEVSQEDSDRNTVSLDQLIANTHVNDGGDNLNIDGEEIGSAKIHDTTNDQQPAMLRSSAWLKDTTSRIAFALESFEKDVVKNENSSVNLALIDLSYGLLNNCFKTLSDYNDHRSIEMPKLLLSWLLEKSSDRHTSNRTSDSAIDALVSLLLKGKTQGNLLIANELSTAAEQLPRLFSKPLGQDDLITQFSDRIGFLAALASGAKRETFSAFNGLNSLFASREFERWLLNLASSLVIEGSTFGDLESVRLGGLEASTSKAFFKSIRELGAAAARAMLNMQDAVNPLTGSISFVEYLIRLSIRWRSMKKKEDSLNIIAILLAREAICGIAVVLGDEKLGQLRGSNGIKIRKSAKRFARTIISFICEIWQADEEELLSGVPLTYEQPLTEEERRIISTQKSDFDTIIEHTKGAPKQSMHKRENSDSVLHLGPAVNVDFVQAASIVETASKGKIATGFISRRQHRKKAIQHAHTRDACLLSILSEAAQILGPSLKPSLVHTLYPTICAVASSDHLTQAAASRALQKISHAAGYASVEGCLLDHADYILGSASHRLISTLGEELHFRSQFAAIQAIKEKTKPEADSTSLLALTLRSEQEEEVYKPLMSALSAPLVLVELIRSLGTEAVVLVEDAIDEVLDAIDRFHADSDICDGLLSVLDRMLEVMLYKATEESQEQLQSPDRGYRPNKETDLIDFENWFHQRGQSEKVGTESLFNGIERSEDQENTEKEDLSDPANEETAAGRSQKVTVSMMKKAIPFLSHSSRTIRMRCLRLINRGVELLCRQNLTAEPLSVVSSCWPIVMSRLGFSLSRQLKSDKYVNKLPRWDEMDEKDIYVAIEAVKLIAILAKYLQSYLGSEKLLRQAMPRIMLLLRIIDESEQRPSEAARPPEKQTTFLLKDDGRTLPSVSKAMTTSPFQPMRQFGPLAILTGTVLAMLTDLVNAMGPSITEADLFTFASHPTFLAALDTRQPREIQESARHFYCDILNDRNAALTWFVMESTIRSSSNIDHSTRGYPTFLYKPKLHFHMS